MMRVAPLALLLALTAGTTPGVQAAERVVSCAGFPLAYGTTIGSSGPSRSEQRLSSVIAIAAVTSANAKTVAWMIWDERGMNWLGLKQTSPADLRQLWAFSVPPNFHGPGIQVRFTPTKKPLPKKYRLTPCVDARP